MASFAPLRDPRFFTQRRKARKGHASSGRAIARTESPFRGEDQKKSSLRASRLCVIQVFTQRRKARKGHAPSGRAIARAESRFHIEGSPRSTTKRRGARLDVTGTDEFYPGASASADRSKCDRSAGRLALHRAPPNFPPRSVAITDESMTAGVELLDPPRKLIAE